MSWVIFLFALNHMKYVLKLPKHSLLFVIFRWVLLGGIFNTCHGSSMGWFLTTFRVGSFFMVKFEEYWLWFLLNFWLIYNDLPIIVQIKLMVWTAKVKVENVWGIYDTGINLYCDPWFTLEVYTHCPTNGPLK